MEIKIRKFHQLSLGELYQLLKIRVDAFVVEQNCPYPELDDKDQQAIHLFMAEKDQIKSYLRIYMTKPGQAAIGRVVTPPPYRGQGLSRKMMEEALRYLESNPEIQSIYLQAQEHLSNFYTSFGFQKTSEIYLEDGIPHVDMEKPMNRD